MKALLAIIIFSQMQTLHALGQYKPGDTLYVWAMSGLTLRDGPSLKAAKLANVPYGTMLKVLNYNGAHDSSVEAVPGYATGEESSPAVLLGGDFAQVTFQAIKGYLFDGYLSTLPIIKYSKTADSGRPHFESLEEWATRSFGLLQKTQTGTFEYGTPSMTQWIFGNGILISGWMEKDGHTRVVLPNVSMEEAFLIFNCMNNYEWQILYKGKYSELDGYRFEKTSLDAWIFFSGACNITIRYLPHEYLAVITSNCSC